MEGVDLDFSPNALIAIAKKALNAGTGARALRMILENLMQDLMFEVPTDDTIRAIFIDEGTILHNEPPTIRRETLRNSQAS